MGNLPPQFNDAERIHSSGNKKKAKFFKDDHKLDKSNHSPSIIFLLKSSAPPGRRYLRDNCDFMNNFYVDIVCRAFTDIDKLIEENEAKKKSDNTKLSL